MCKLLEVPWWSLLLSAVFVIGIAYWLFDICMLMVELDKDRDEWISKYEPKDKKK